MKKAIRRTLKKLGLNKKTDEFIEITIKISLKNKDNHEEEC